MVVVARCFGVVVLLIGSRVGVVFAFLGCHSCSCPACFCTDLPVSVTCLDLFSAPARSMSGGSTGMLSLSEAETLPDCRVLDVDETILPDMDGARPAKSHRTEKPELAPLPAHVPESIIMIPDDDEDASEDMPVSMTHDDLLPDGYLEYAEVHTMHGYLEFFENPGPGQCHRFAMTVVCDCHRTTAFDELSLDMSDQGEKFLQYNAKGPHGTWSYNDPPSPKCFLDIKLNTKFGDPGNTDAPDVGRFFRFQKIPGTKAWVRCSTKTNQLCMP